MKIKVKYVNLPKEGKTFGNIKASDDQVYMYIPGDFKFEVGKEYDIGVKNAKWGENQVVIIESANGEKFKTDAGKNKGAGGGGFKGGGGKSGDPKLDFAGRICAAAIVKGCVTDPASLKKWFDMSYKLSNEAPKD